MTRPKLLIIGPARHGKDSVGAMLNGYGFKCLASSEFASARIMLPYFLKQGKTYSSATECFEDRVNGDNRAIWFQQIEAYNAPTWDRVAREMLADGFDTYLGMRSRKEFEASKHLFDKVIWVDASKRLPPEASSSNELTADDADIVLDNNSTLLHLRVKVRQLVVDLLDEPSPALSYQTAKSIATVFNDSVVAAHNKAHESSMTRMEYLNLPETELTFMLELVYPHLVGRIAKTSSAEVLQNWREE